MPRPVELLPAVERFLKRNKMTQTAFGLAVMNDRSFVAYLRAGRSPTLVTYNKVMDFIRAA